MTNEEFNNEHYILNSNIYRDKEHLKFITFEDYLHGETLFFTGANGVIYFLERNNGEKIKLYFWRNGFVPIVIFSENINRENFLKMYKICKHAFKGY